MIETEVVGDPNGLAHAPLIISPETAARLHQLRDQAHEVPIDMERLVVEIATPEGKAAHMKRMTRQSVLLDDGPFAFIVAYSLETNHPSGTFRHMSMSIQREGRIPNKHALWMVAEYLGFQGSLEACVAYREELQGHGCAINVLQPLRH